MEQPTAGRILVVDDQPNMCWVISKLLTLRGHEVRTAEDGAGALATLAGFDCQVAVVDYRLPDWCGLTLIVRMRELLPGLRAILMTSYGSAALRQRAVDEGVFAYLDKPFNNDLMVCTIEEAVRTCGAGADSLTPGDRARTRFPGRATSRL